MERRIRKDGQKKQRSPKPPLGQILADAAGVNVNTVYQLGKLLNKYIEVKPVTK